MSPSFVNAAYYPCWRIYRDLPPSSLQLDFISHVLYAFVLINTDGTLRFLDEHADCTIAADGEQGCLSAVSKLKAHRPWLKTLVSMGGGTGSAEFPAMAADPAARETFARSCREFVDRWGFDGVDIDWECPETPQDGANYMALLHALRRALPRPRYLLTTALPVGEYCLRHLDLPTAGHLLDYLNLMAYDFVGPWTDVCGHQGQLLPPPGKLEHTHPNLRNSCHGAVEYILSRGFPATKLILGIPVYARSFEGTHGVGQPFTKAEEMDYNEMPREWIHQASIDQSAGAASFVDRSPGGKGFVSFDVPETVQRKAEYVKWMGLGGLFYWTGVGDIKGPESLVWAGYQALHSNSQSS
ncbi:glycoside hydrolase superfamily [Pseudomassariella vexata]|uniref:chitinase n=1 Tax=Pseudomassariella vexata TaxID=1141098 RepID=A0A1Y2EAB5_9PEZI|nr:glycoside hydrolase superfamily [Pseudomassariella vexata]ORY68530.1 glycoside hydrolase superfamily [Pseudomassariella vexata]